MTQRITPPAELTESRKMLKQAERDEESRRLAVLMERVKRQLATMQTAATPSRAA